MTRKKIAIFSFVTTRPISHSGWCVCIRNCVDEFGMDPGHWAVLIDQLNFL